MGIVSSELSKSEQLELRRATYLSLFVSVVLLVGKFWAYNLTHSQAIFSDAVESIVNVFTAMGAILVIIYSARPADSGHPYGHGKVEYFSAAFEGGLIVFAALFIFIESVKALIEGKSAQQLDFGLLLTIIAGVINLGLGFYLHKRGVEKGSIALKASAKHVISDFWTSLGVVIGLILVYFTGIAWLDAVTAILVGCLLVYSGLQLMRESMAGLMDEQDVKVLEELAQVFSANAKEGIIQIHNVKTIRSGWYHHIDAHVVLPEFWTVKEVHDKMGVFEKDVIKSYPYGGEMNFHFDPCRKAYCRVCDLHNCPIRQEQFVERHPVVIQDLQSKVEPPEFRKHRKS